MSVSPAARVRSTSKTAPQPRPARRRSGTVEIGAVAGECKVVAPSAAASRSPERRNHRSQWGVGHDRGRCVRRRRAGAHDIGAGHGWLELGAADLDVRGSRARSASRFPTGVAPDSATADAQRSGEEGRRSGHRLRHRGAHREARQGPGADYDVGLTRWRTREPCSCRGQSSSPTSSTSTCGTTWSGATTSCGGVARTPDAARHRPAPVVRVRIVKELGDGLTRRVPHPLAAVATLLLRGAGGGHPSNSTATTRRSFSASAGTRWGAPKRRPDDFVGNVVNLVARIVDLGGRGRGARWRGLLEAAGDLSAPRRAHATSSGRSTSRAFPTRSRRYRSRSPPIGCSDRRSPA